MDHFKEQRNYNLSLLAQKQQQKQQAQKQQVKSEIKPSVNIRYGFPNQYYDQKPPLRQVRNSQKGTDQGLFNQCYVMVHNRVAR